MFCSCGLHRRGVFKLAGGFAATLRLGLQSAQAQGAPPTLSGTGGTLPARGEFVVRGGHVLTMDASLGDLPGGDVHVRDGAIVAVGVNLDAPAAQVIDGRDLIVMPGFVDTHCICGAPRCG
jgi:5-methylthioadenosine/S-adenosylhomocysteine deaminase